MIKRTVEISQSPAHLRVRNQQLEILRKNEQEEEEPVSIPCEDIGMLMVDSPQSSYSHTALIALAESGAAVVMCGRNHLPAGIMLPFGEHSEIQWRIDDQLGITQPIRKQLWQQIVQAKIRAQAVNLDPRSTQRIRLLELARRVKSGDPTNVEAQAARVYWSAWLGPDSTFRRNPDGDDFLNIHLNYGYSVIRAAVARAVVGAGLLPALGLFHSNRSNAFGLADDLMEPLRPLVDAQVQMLSQRNLHELCKESKAALLGVLSQTVRQNETTGPLMVSLHCYVISYLRCLQKEEKTLSFPVAI